MVWSGQIAAEVLAQFVICGLLACAGWWGVQCSQCGEQKCPETLELFHQASGNAASRSGGKRSAARKRLIYDV